jgi:hypothetical protein
VQGLSRGRRVDHERGHGDYTAVVSLDDTRVDARAKAKVVRGDDESPHGGRFYKIFSMRNAFSVFLHLVTVKGWCRLFLPLPGREKRGWVDLHGGMSKVMVRLQSVPGLSGIEQMEYVDKVGPEVRKYHCLLTYDTGAWAFAFMIHKSESRSIAERRTKLYPAVAEHGWEAALVVVMSTWTSRPPTGRSGNSSNSRSKNNWPCWKR